MLTPQDIQNKPLEKAVFGGYDMGEVDDFLEEVARDYAAVYKENAILKSKMKVLVEKVEEYRSTEDAMRMALLTAQKMGDDLLSDAKKKSKSLLIEADSAAKMKMEEIRREIEEEEQKLASAKAATQRFIEESKQVLAKHAAFLSTLDMGAPADDTAEEIKKSANSLENPVNEEKKEAAIVDTAKEIDEVVSKMLESDPEPAGQTKPSDSTDDTKMFRTKNDNGIDWSDDDEYTSPRPKFDFNDLKFGSNYTDEE